MAYEWEHEEWRDAVLAAEDSGELDHYYWDRPARRPRDWDLDEAEWEPDGPFEGYDDE